MTIHKKIIISNVVMIVIPVIIALSAMLWLLEGVGSRYWETLENMYEDRNEIYSAQSLVYAYKEELEKLIGDKVTAMEEQGENVSSVVILKEGRMQEIEDELCNIGYHFSVVLKDKLFFSNITAEEQEMAERLLRDTATEADRVMISSRANAAVKQVFYEEGWECEILAVRTAESITSSEHRSYIRNYMFHDLLVVAGSVLAVILVVNLLLSRWLSRSILIPLQKLGEGSRKIKDGELDFQVEYYKEDEFGKVCRDFDEMRGYLQESVEERLKYEKYRGVLLSGISHDLRTPLTSIKGYVEGLIEGIADSREKQERYYRAIHIRAKDMEVLVDNLSTYTHLESHNDNYDFECVDLNVYITDILKSYETDAVENRVSVTCGCCGEELRVLIDCKKFGRVIANIFFNSIKYRNKKQSVVDVRTCREDEWATLIVRDDGPGVPDGDLEHIFECFYRGDASRTRPGEGSGLGLSIAKQIIEGHGGRIRAENRQGLAVIICLPLYKKE